MWYWHKDKHIEHWKRIKNLEINPNIQGQLGGEGNLDVYLTPYAKLTQNVSEAWLSSL